MPSYTLEQLSRNNEVILEDLFVGGSNKLLRIRASSKRRKVVFEHFGHFEPTSSQNDSQKQYTKTSSLKADHSMLKLIMEAIYFKEVKQYKNSQFCVKIYNKNTAGYNSDPALCLDFLIYSKGWYNSYYKLSNEAYNIEGSHNLQIANKLTELHQQVERDL